MTDEERRKLREIEEARRRINRAYHPDMWDGDREKATETMAEINDRLDRQRDQVRKAGQK